MRISQPGGGESAAQQTLGARAKGGGGSGEASAQRWSRAFRVRAALVSSGGVPPSLPGTPAGWLPGAKRVGRLLWSRGHERVPERGLDSPKHHRAGACCFIEIMGNSQIASSTGAAQLGNLSQPAQSCGCMVTWHCRAKISKNLRTRCVIDVPSCRRKGEIRGLAQSGLTLAPTLPNIPIQT